MIIDVESYRAEIANELISRLDVLIVEIVRTDGNSDGNGLIEEPDVQTSNSAGISSSLLVSTVFPRYASAVSYIFWKLIKIRRGH